MSSITAFLTSVERKRMSVVTAIAPMNAAANIATCPPRGRLAAPRTPPPKGSMTKATAKPAPLLMPNTSGPARGLTKAVCSISPLAAREVPANKAATACGKRERRMIKRQDSLTLSSPRSVAIAS